MFDKRDQLNAILLIDLSGDLPGLSVFLKYICSIFLYTVFLIIKLHFKAVTHLKIVRYCRYGTE